MCIYYCIDSDIFFMGSDILQRIGMIKIIISRAPGINISIVLILKVL